MFTRNIRTKSVRTAALAGASLLAVAASNFAQAAETAANGAPEEIIVTALRRAERLQDVPITMTVATPAQLERAAVTNMRDLTVLSPGFVATGQGGFFIPALRGVTSINPDPGNDANVAIYIDGVLQGDNLSSAVDFPDVSRIEVLKGPQGTLFGRNSTGGAIRIFTRGPSMDKYEGTLDVGYGNYNNATFKGFVSAPLVEGKLAASLSGAYETIDPYTFNIATNRKSKDTTAKSLRFKIRAQPTDNLSAELFGSYIYRNDGEVSSYTSYQGNSAARGRFGAVIPTQPFTYAFNGVSMAKGQIYTGGLRVGLETGIGKFESTTAYNMVKSIVNNDTDFSTADLQIVPNRHRQKTWSQELLFTSKKFNQFQFVAGGYYYADTARYDPLGLFGPDFGGALYGYQRQRTKAEAVFGEVTYEPTDRITFIVGGRYSHERREAQGSYYITPGRPAVLPPVGSPVSYNSFTPRASVRYRLTEQGDNIYFTFSEGFKSGGFNISGLQPAPFKPEKLRSYEIGVKTSPSRMLSANISGFYYDYTNLQVSANVNNLNITTNAATSRIYGADVEVMARLSDEFSLTANMEVLDAKYQNYPNAPLNVTILNPDGSSCLCGFATGTGDLSGGRMPLAPKLTFSISPEYKTEISAGLISLSAHIYYSSSFSGQSSPVIYTKSYATLSLRASFQPTDSNFTFYGWGKNVTGSKYVMGALITNEAAGVRYARPATYGAGVKYAF